MQKDDLLHSIQTVERSPQADYEVAMIPENKLRNRFGNIFPCKTLNMLAIILRYMIFFPKMTSTEWF